MTGGSQSPRSVAGNMLPKPVLMLVTLLLQQVQAVAVNDNVPRRKISEARKWTSDLNSFIKNINRAAEAVVTQESDGINKVLTNIHRLVHSKGNWTMEQTGDRLNGVAEDINKCLAIGEDEYSPVQAIINEVKAKLTEICRSSKTVLLTCIEAEAELSKRLACYTRTMLTLSESAESLKSEMVQKILASAQNCYRMAMESIKRLYYVTTTTATPN